MRVSENSLSFKVASKHLFRIRENKRTLGSSVGAADFLERRLDEATFFRPSQEVLKEHVLKSKKYTKLIELSEEVSKIPKEQELNHLLNQAAASRDVQMTETYISNITYLTLKSDLLDEIKVKELLKHIRHVTLLTGSWDLLESIRKRQPHLLKLLNFPETVRESFPVKIAALIPRMDSIENYCYDNQTNLQQMCKNLNSVSEKMSTQQRLGMSINKACLQRSERNYLVAFNRLLNEHNLTSMLDATLASNNVLGTFKFNTVDIPRAVQPECVSVIMSCYNASKTIEYAVSSILKQSHSNLELLVCDDQSDDDTLVKLKDLARLDSRVRVFESRSNQGTYNIRNSLVPYASGDYITFHDSDDIAHPQRLDEQLNHLKSKSLMVSSCRWIRITPEGQTVFFVDGRILRFCVVSTMVHRSVFNYIPKFRPSLVAADTEFHENCLMLLGHENVGILDKPLILGLWGDGSLTKMTDLSAEHNGFVASRRRAYSDIAARQRVLGSDIISDEEVELVLKEQHIYRDFSGVREISVHNKESNNKGLAE